MSLIAALLDFVFTLSATIFQGSGLTLPTTTELARFWETLSPATCMPNHCFCEPVVSGLIRQPINTWTNLAFILAAAMTTLVAILDLIDGPRMNKNTNLMRSQWIYPATFAYTTALVGVSSMLYHGTMAFIGQVFDILGMYLLSTFMALYNLSRAFKLKGSIFFGLYLAVNIVLGIISTAMPEYRRLIFVSILVVILVTELMARKMVSSKMSRKLLGATLASLIIGCSTWILDVSGLFCMSNSWLQLHSIWHIGMAAAIGFLYLYYRSERPLIAETKS